jgi:hypothetical protein
MSPPPCQHRPHNGITASQHGHNNVTTMSQHGDTMIQVKSKKLKVKIMPEQCRNFNGLAMLLTLDFQLAMASATNCVRDGL